MERRVAAAHPTQLCPGFCGRVRLNASNPLQNIYSECGYCPYGTRAFDNFECIPCSQPLSAYDYSFLAFHAVAPLFINAVCIRLYTKPAIRPKRATETTTFWQVAQLLSATCEAVLSLLTALLIFPPFGHLTLNGCRRGRIQEWYPTFHNPVVNRTVVLKCSSEVVFPLFSLPFVVYALMLLNLLLFRSAIYGIAHRCRRPLSSAPYYAALWSLPIMAAIHGVMAGLVYYSFAHICVFAALLSNAVHLASEGRRGVLELCKLVFRTSERLGVVLVHTALFGFGVFALYFYPPPGHWYAWSLYMLCLPMPVLFYCLTVRLTEPPRQRSRR